MMDNGEYMDEGMNERIQNFERMLNSGDTFFYDNDELGQIIDFYIDFEQLNKANKAIAYAESLYPFETYYKVKKAEVYIAERNINGAVKLLEKYKSIEPENDEIAKLLGDCYAITLQFKKAIDCYQLALKKDTKSEELLLRLARVNFALGNNKKALSYINAVPNDYEYDELSIQEFVRLFMDYNEYSEAISFLEKVINTNPYNYAAWYFKGLVYQRKEDYLSAVDAYEYCIAIDESNTMGHLGKGNSLMELNEFPKAIESYMLSLDNDETDAEVLCNIAECFENLKDDENAKKFYKKSITINQNLSDAYFGLAMVYKRNRQLKDAERNLLKSIDIDKYESLYHIELAEIYLIQEDKEKCYEHYQLAYELDSDTTEILLDYAHSMVEMKEISEAVDLLLENLENHDEDHRIYYRIASYSLSIGQKEKGYNFLHAALKMAPNEYILVYEFAPFLENDESVTNIIDLYSK
ncbi:MAG: tetratricopeptide repeat protein [Bacteroidia bacterium]